MAADVQRVSFGRATLTVGGSAVQIDGGVTIEYKLDSKPVKAPQISHFPLGDVVNGKEFAVEAVLKDVGADLALAFGKPTYSTGFTLDTGVMIYVAVVVTLYTHPVLNDSVTITLPYAAVVSQGSTDLNDDEGGHGFPIRFEARKQTQAASPVTFAYVG